MRPSDDAPSSILRTTLLVHYHRPANDYNGWFLSVHTPNASTTTYAQVCSTARTSFGVCFRIRSPHTSFTLQPIHASQTAPSRHLTPPHPSDVFLADPCPRPHINPDAFLFAGGPRFLALSLPPTSPSPWLVVYAGSRIIRHIFPATPAYRLAASLFLLDLSTLPTGNIYLDLATTDKPLPSNPQPSHCILRLPPSASSFSLCDSPLSLSSSNAPALLPLLVHQAARIPYFSSICLPPPAYTPRPMRPACTTLRLYHHHLSHTPPPILSLPLKTYPDERRYHSGKLITADLTGLTPAALSKGIELYLNSPAPSLKWTPELGLDVICITPSPRLLTPQQADLLVCYHRYVTNDWRNWYLHLTTKPRGEYPALDHFFPPNCPNGFWGILYDLTGIVLPDACARLQPLYIPSAHLTHPSANVAASSDIAREWTGTPASRILHLIQGVSDLYACAPTPEKLLYTRRFRVRYRRFLAADYQSWVLYTAGGTCEASACHVPFIASDVSRAWADYIVDRGAYGDGSVVSAVPRKDDDTHAEQDGEVRVISTQFLDSCPFEDGIGGRLRTCIVVQGGGVFSRIGITEGMLRVFVDGPSSVLVRFPFPRQWMPGINAKGLDDVGVWNCEENALPFLKAHAYMKKRELPFRRIRRVSHTEIRLLFDEATILFEEDFLVENVVVYAPGFGAVVLSWKICEDWDEYLYKGDLGWEYSVDQCCFRCFSPTACGVSLVLYDTAVGKSGRTVVPMRRIPEGCWKAIVQGDLKGKYYKLLSEGENKRLFPGVEVIDPYSRCNTSHTGRGLIFGTENTNICARPNVEPSEAIVYELHIRDVTVDDSSGILSPGKFMGLAERDTLMKDISKKNALEPLTPWHQEKMQCVREPFQYLNKLSTGLDHIAQMGVNTIQILPIQDFDNDESNDKAYKWGYMPVHFNSPDGWYASKTDSVARVTEFKMLVDAIHKAGLKVIMDVVYNHTAEDSNEFNLQARFSFNGIAPRYYYRTCGNTPVAHTGESTCARRGQHEARCGECYSNGSGCGNEFRSESPMGRKFVIDSLKYWVNEYRVDGFRFDLLGLIDVETLTQASAALRSIDPKILIYGEPWCGGMTPIRSTEKGMQRSRGFGVFNNSFRDAIRGSPFGIEETFVMDGGRLSEVKAGIIGSIDDFCDIPLETINYVECHDNYTLWDHMRFYIRLRTDDISFTEEDMRRMNRLAAVLIFTSQGVPFMQAGQEMCRTKFDVENSYESPDDINKIRWRRKQSEWRTVQYYRGLILLRRSHPEIFCLKTSQEVHGSIIFYEDLGLPIPERCIAYKMTGNPAKLLTQLEKNCFDVDRIGLREESLKWTELVLLFNPTPSDVVFQLPQGDTNQVWIQIVDAINAGVRNIGGPFVGHVTVQGRSASVLRRASDKDAFEAQLSLRLACFSDSYCSFHGDNVLSRYAVGLTHGIANEDIVTNRDLMSRRKQFEERNRRARPSAFLKQSRMTEAEAIRAVDRKHGRLGRLPVATSP